MPFEMGKAWGEKERRIKPQPKPEPEPEPQPAPAGGGFEGGGFENKEKKPRLVRFKCSLCRNYFEVPDDARYIEPLLEAASRGVDVLCEDCKKLRKIFENKK
jgi:hypothetical protein